MRLRSLWHFNEITFFVLDYVLLWGAVVCAFKLSPRYPLEILYGIWLRPELHLIGYGMPLCMALGLQLAGVQRSQAGFHSMETLVRTVTGLVGGMAVFVMLHAVFEFELIGRYVLIFSLLYGTAFILGSRLLVWKLAEQATSNILVYGGKTSTETVKAAVKAAALPISIIGHTRLPGMIGDKDTSPAFLTLEARGLHGYCEKNAIEGIVVEVSETLHPLEREALLHCTGQGVRVVDLGHFFEHNLERVHVPSLRETWFWNYDPALSHPVYFTFKRFVDVTMSVLGLLAFLPLAPFVVLLIKLQDGGPVIYSQWRTGLYNQPFRIFKFRTMRQDAEKDGVRWATQSDQRVTLVGRILRKTRIDEVPQFWNILNGDMSFIGPRPEQPEAIASCP